MGRTRKDAFTLIELLVVIAVIAIIAAILFPVLVAARKKAYQATCLSNLKQIGAATLMYIDDYDGTFPFVLCYSGNAVLDQANGGDDGKYPVVPGVTGTEPQFRLVTLVSPYLRNENVWYCPSVGPDYVVEQLAQATGKRRTMREQGTTYGYTYRSFNSDATRIILMGGKPYAMLLDPSRWPMLFDEPNGYWYTGSVGDPPASAVPHFGGLNVGYGDGHAKFARMEKAGPWIGPHAGDGLFPGQ